MMIQVSVAAAKSWLLRVSIVRAKGRESPKSALNGNNHQNCFAHSGHYTTKWPSHLENGNDKERC